MNERLVKKIARIFLVMAFVFFLFGCDEIENIEKRQEQEKIEMEKNAGWLSVQPLLKKDGMVFYIIKDTKEDVEYLLVKSNVREGGMAITKMEKGQKNEQGY